MVEHVLGKDGVEGPIPSCGTLIVDLLGANICAPPFVLLIFYFSCAIKMLYFPWTNLAEIMRKLTVDKNLSLACLLLLLASEIVFQEYRSFFQINTALRQSSRATIESSSVETVKPGLEEEQPQLVHETDPDEEQSLIGLQTRTIYVTCGDTLSSILSDLGISLRDIDAISKKLAKVYSLKSLQIGQALDVQWDSTEKGAKLRVLEFEDARGNRISLVADGEGYKVTFNARVLTTRWVAANGVIQTTFMSAGRRVNIPQSVLGEAMQALSPLIKSRFLKVATTFDIVYEEKRNEKSGKREGRPALRYVSVSRGDEKYSVYVFGNQYFSEKGESLKTEFLVLPFKNQKPSITSKFGLRKHPILGVVKNHYGVDYAARYGTDVCAAANGVVVMAGFYGAYGRYVRIRHANGFETAYGHLSSICVKKGDAVAQGDCIGKVGSSGRATGPHLHHEVIRNQVRVDPQKYTSMGTVRLVGKEMARFRKFKAEIQEHLQHHLGDGGAVESLREQQQSTRDLSDLEHKVLLTGTPCQENLLYTLLLPPFVTIKDGTFMIEQGGDKEGQSSWGRFSLGVKESTGTSFESLKQGKI